MTAAARTRIVRLEAGVVAIVLAALGLALGLAVQALPPSAPSAGEAVLRRLAESGVDSRVSAVLMNFRGYDTMLELGVLFLALLGVWSLGPMPRSIRAGPPPLILDVVSRLLVPFLVLLAAFLLWAGAEAWGGAFQAGAVVGAAGVLIVLSAEHPREPVPAVAARVVLALGLLAFVAAAFATLAGGTLLEYPPALAKAVILAIEAAGAVSIGCTLLAVLLGGVPRTQSTDRGSSR